VSAIPGAPTGDEIREYLLRRLPENARARFEEAYFRDDALLDRIESEEDRLILDYVLGRLAQTDRRRFEDSLLGSSYYRDRVQSTTQLNLKLMKSSAFRKPTAPRPATAGTDERLFPARSGWVVAFALLLVLLLASLVTTLHFKRQYQAALQRAAAAEVASRRVEKPARPLVTRVLTPSPSGPSMMDLAVPPGSQLQLAIPRQSLPKDAAQIRPLLLGQDGRIIWDGGLRTATDLPSGDLLLTLPEAMPPSGISVLAVEAVETSGIRVLPLGYLNR